MPKKKIESSVGRFPLSAGLTPDNMVSIIALKSGLLLMQPRDAILFATAVLRCACIADGIGEVP